MRSSLTLATRQPFFVKTSPLKETDYFVAWLLYFVCALVGGAIAGGIAGGIIGAVLGLMRTEPQLIRVAGRIVGFLSAIPISYLCFRLIVAQFVVKKVVAQTDVPPTALP